METKRKIQLSTALAIIVNGLFILSSPAPLIATEFGCPDKFTCSSTCWDEQSRKDFCEADGPPGTFCQLGTTCSLPAGKGSCKSFAYQINCYWTCPPGKNCVRIN